MIWQKLVAHLAVATAKNVYRVRDAIVAAVAAQRMRQVSNAVAVFQILVQHKQRNRPIQALERASFC